MMDQNTEKKRINFPGGRARLWQMGICLALFITALFFRAVTGKELVPTAGAASLREMAEHAGQVLARSELAEAFADGFRSAADTDSPVTPVGPSAARRTTSRTTTATSTSPETTRVPETTAQTPQTTRLPEPSASTLPLLTKPAYTE